jgi:hypothetical protein
VVAASLAVGVAGRRLMGDIAWNRDPRAAAQIPLRHTSVVKARLAQDTDHTLAETVNSRRPDGAHHQRQNISRNAPR